MESKVTLTQMLKVLDKDVGAGIEKKLKKLSKKKALEKPLDKNKSDQLERKAAYDSANKDVSKWDPVVKKNKQAKQLKFPLDQELDVLPSTAESLSDIQPRNDLERAVKNIIDKNSIRIPTKEQISEAEERYRKAIDPEEVTGRHRELQRMRVLLSTYAAKMRRQKAIKSKSYHRLLKRERIRNHMKKVETDQDALMDEIERLHKLRAEERASLKHKNTGKWAKHAKFRAKYDDEARKAMMDQIGIANKLLEKPAELSSDSDSCSDSEETISDTESNSATVGPTKPEIDSKETLLNNLKSNRDTDDDQRQLMSEAFADDDVVTEFKLAKEQLIDEEQPKDKDTYLPGWDDWAGPGTVKLSNRKRKRFIIKAKKIIRKDSNLGNVVISERADENMKEFMISKLPRNIKNEKQLTEQLTKPTTGTFVSQSEHRESIKPRIQTKLGVRIEPISKRMLKHDGAKWAS